MKVFNNDGFAFIIVGALCIFLGGVLHFIIPLIHSATDLLHNSVEPSDDIINYKLNEKSKFDEKIKPKPKVKPKVEKKPDNKVVPKNKLKFDKKYKSWKKVKGISELRYKVRLINIARTKDSKEYVASIAYFNASTDMGINFALYIQAKAEKKTNNTTGKECYYKYYNYVGTFYVRPQKTSDRYIMIKNSNIDSLVFEIRNVKRQKFVQESSSKKENFILKN